MAPFIPEYSQRYQPEIRTHQIFETPSSLADPVKAIASVWPPEGFRQVQSQRDVTHLRHLLEDQNSTTKTIQAWIAKLTPEMKAAILKKGFPLMSLGLLGGQSQSNDPLTQQMIQRQGK